MIDNQGAAPKELLRNDNNRTSRYFQDGAEGGQPLIFPMRRSPVDSLAGEAEKSLSLFLKDGSLAQDGCAGFQLKEGASGAVTLIQRFGSVLNLNIHFHLLFLDGVYNQEDCNEF
jgi:hypothetical protein